MPQAKAGLTIAGYFVLLMSAAMIGGSIFRNEMSPWAWTQFGIDAARHGTVDALLGVLLYVAFYSMGFVLPWSVLTFTIWLRYVYQTHRAPAIDMSAVRGWRVSNLRRLSTRVWSCSLSLRWHSCETYRPRRGMAGS